VKALILCGGTGTRLRPITHTSAKQLVPVANKPILYYGLEAMAEAGITDVGMVVGDTADEVMAAVGDGSQWGMTVTYIPQDAPRGIAHCVLIARDYLGEDDFVMYLGDNLLQQGLKDFTAAFERDRQSADHPTFDGVDAAPAAQILLARVPDPQRFGVAALDSDGHVIQLVEKPAVPPSDLALVGVYLFDAHVHEAVAAIQPSARGELEITDAIQWLIDHGHRVRAEILEGWWMDTGKLTPLLEANRLILETIEGRIDGEVDGDSEIEGRVIVEAGAKVVRSRIRGPVIVGEGTRVTDSYIGPFTALAEDCEVVGSELEHAVVLAHSRILNAGAISDSLLGKHTEVTRSQRRPHSTRLMLGDHSVVDLS
jgi:glucose-1-phosphate thymidylyltransferase